VSGNRAKSLLTLTRYQQAMCDPGNPCARRRRARPQGARAGRWVGLIERTGTGAFRGSARATEAAEPAAILRVGETNGAGEMNRDPGNESWTVKAKGGAGVARQLAHELAAKEVGARSPIGSGGNGLLTLTRY
jgi:hypothetical protein